jgi:NAD(P)-dependent dehydrogenase (short-subunit alcohol dehydrogenase family)
MSRDVRHLFDPTELAGRRVLVTGGTEGVGEAIVKRLVAAGAKVATTARSELQRWRSKRKSGRQIHRP